MNRQDAINALKEKKAYLRLSAREETAEIISDDWSYMLPYSAGIRLIQDAVVKPFNACAANKYRTNIFKAE